MIENMLKAFLIPADNKINEIDYLSVFSAAENATPFHSYYWNKAIAKQIKTEFLYLKLVLNSVVIAILPLHKKNSKIYYSSGIWGSYGGFIFEEKFRSYVAQWLKKPIPYLFYPILLSDYYNDDLFRYRIKKEKYTTWTIDCHNGDYELFFKKTINSKIRNQIRKCEKTGVVIRAAHSNDALSVFELYKNFCLEKNINLIYDIDFFSALIKSPKNEISCTVAELSGIIIGCAFFLKSKKQTFYWQSYFNRDFSINNPISGILAHSIEDSFSSVSCVEFNFGAVPYGLNSLEFFKKHWGATARNYHYSLVFV